MAANAAGKKIHPGSVGLDEPLSWEEIVRYVKDGSVEALGNMGRSKECLFKYRKVRAEVRSGLSLYHSMNCCFYAP